MVLAGKLETVSERKRESERIAGVEAGQQGGTASHDLVHELDGPFSPNAAGAEDQGATAAANDSRPPGTIATWPGRSGVRSRIGRLHPVRRCRSMSYEDLSINNQGLSCGMALRPSRSRMTASSPSRVPIPSSPPEHEPHRTVKPLGRPRFPRAPAGRSASTTTPRARIARTGDPPIPCPRCGVPRRCSTIGPRSSSGTGGYLRGPGHPPRRDQVSRGAQKSSIERAQGPRAFRRDHLSLHHIIEVRQAVPRSARHQRYRDGEHRGPSEIRTEQQGRDDAPSPGSPPCSTPRRARSGSTPPSYFRPLDVGEHLFPRTVRGREPDRLGDSQVRRGTEQEEGFDTVGPFL